MLTKNQKCSNGHIYNFHPSKIIPASTPNIIWRHLTALAGLASLAGLTALAGFGFLGLGSWVCIPGFGFLGVDSWVWIPGFGFLIWIPGFVFLGLASWVWIPGFGVLGLESWAWIPGFGFLAWTYYQKWLYLWFGTIRRHFETLWDPNHWFNLLSCFSRKKCMDSHEDANFWRTGWETV